MYINDIRHILLIQQSTQIAIYQIRSKSRMRSVHLLGLLVLLAVLSSSMANHKPDHDTVTTNVPMVTIPDLRGKRLRRSPGHVTGRPQKMKPARWFCPSNCCRKCSEMPEKCSECPTKRSKGYNSDELCEYNNDPTKPFSDCRSG